MDGARGRLNEAIEQTFEFEVASYNCSHYNWGTEVRQTHVRRTFVPGQGFSRILGLTASAVGPEVAGKGGIGLCFAVVFGAKLLRVS